MLDLVNPFRSRRRTVRFHWLGRGTKPAGNLRFNMDPARLVPTVRLRDFASAWIADEHHAGALP
jgi:hypothetical protein